MGICVIRFKESEEVVRWGIVENNLVMPLSTHYASHRDLMDAFSDNPTSLQFYRLVGLGAALRKKRIHPNYP